MQVAVNSDLPDHIPWEDLPAGRHHPPAEAEASEAVVVVAKVAVIREEEINLPLFSFALFQSFRLSLILTLYVRALCR